MVYKQYEIILIYMCGMKLYLLRGPRRIMRGPRFIIGPAVINIHPQQQWQCSQAIYSSG